MATVIQLRRDTASNWTSSNPTLSDGEFGYEKDTGKNKIGDGVTAWTSLSYIASSGGSSTISELTDTTISTPTDGQSLVYDNASSKWVNGSISGSGDMVKSTYDTNASGVVDNAEKVNNLTVQTAVPSGAVFTDTVYTHPSGDGDKHIPANGTSNSGKVLTAGATAGLYTWETPSSGGSGSTDLAISAKTATTLDITSSSGNNATIPASTTSLAGLLTGSDKTKLNGIAVGANKYAHPTTTGNKHVPAGGQAGDILAWNGDGSANWAAPEGGTGSTTIDGLTDTTITSPTDAQVLSYDNATSKWINSTVSGSGSSTVSDLTDTTITSIANGNILQYDSTSSKWKNVPLSGGGDALRAGGNTFSGVQIVGTSTAVTNNAIDFSLENCYTFTATANSVSASNFAIGQSGVIIVNNAENITGWSTEFKWKSVPTNLSGTEVFSYFADSLTSIRIGRLS